MKKKLKVIMIAHASHSYFANKEDDLKKIVLNDWYFKTASQLKKFYNEVEVECWAPEKNNSEYEEYVENEIKLRFFPVSFSPLYGMDFSFSMLLALKKEVEKSYREGYEVVIHLHECHNLHGLVILDLFKNVRIIVQHHGGSWPLRHLRESWKKRLFFPLFLVGQWYENRVICNAEKFYALSEDEMNYLKNKDCNVVFRTMGIGDEYFEEVSKEYARRKLGLNEKEKMVFFLGRVDRVKGVDYLLKAMKAIKEGKDSGTEGLKNVKLKIAGYGKEREELVKWARDNGLDNVEFLGGVFGEKKMLYLSACDLLVLPSLKEGAPVTVMEAMARNRPSVVSDVGGVRMMIEDGKTGKVIRKKSVNEIVDGIREVLSWKKKDVKSYADIYKWEKIVEDTVKDYKEL